MSWDWDKLTPTAARILRQAGWNENREVPTSQFILANENIGLSVSKAAERFLRNVGNLRFVHPHFADKNDMLECSFNVEIACNFANTNSVRLYESHVNESLTVIGLANHDYITLLVSSSGKVLGGYESDLISIGDTPASAINNLCDAKELSVEEVPRDLLIRNMRPQYSLEPFAVAAFNAAGRDVSRAISTSPDDDMPNRFLAKYGGCSIDCTCADNSQDKCNFFGSYVSPPWHCPTEVLERIGQPAIPIGEIEKAGIRLVMDDQGHVYGYFPELPSSLWSYGKSGEQAINNIISGRGGIRL